MPMDVLGNPAWANNAPVDTEVIVPVGSLAHGQTVVHVFNPGAVAISFKPRANWTGADAVARKSTFSPAPGPFVIAAGLTLSFLLGDYSNVDNLELAFKNDVVVGAAGAFTARVAVETV